MGMDISSLAGLSGMQRKLPTPPADQASGSPPAAQAAPQSAASLPNPPSAPEQAGGSILGGTDNRMKLNLGGQSPLSQMPRLNPGGQGPAETPPVQAPADQSGSAAAGAPSVDPSALSTINFDPSVGMNGASEQVPATSPGAASSAEIDSKLQEVRSSLPSSKSRTEFPSMDTIKSAQAQAQQYASNYASNMDQAVKEMEKQQLRDNAGAAMSTKPDATPQVYLQELSGK